MTLKAASNLHKEDGPQGCLNEEPCLDKRLFAPCWVGKSRVHESKTRFDKALAMDRELFVRILK